MKNKEKKENDTFFQQDPGLRNYFRAGLIALILFFGGFILWSLLFPLDSAAIAPGKLIVESERKSIQHLEGGIIEKIYVKNGSVVKKGQLLIKLEDTQAQATLNLYQSQVHELLAEEARLIAERDKSGKIDWHKRTLNKKDDNEVKELMKSHQQLFKSNLETHKGQIEVFQQRIRQLEKEIESIQAQVTSVKQQIVLINEELEAVIYLEKRKLIDKPRLLALKREAARLKGNLGEYLGKIAKAQQKISETKQEIYTLKSERRRNILSDLRDVQARLGEVLEKEKAAEDILRRTRITAPQSGVVLGLQQHTIGGVVKAGETILEIVPVQDKIVAEAHIDPNDIDIVRPGLKAHVRLLAYQQRTTPELEGVVSHISADIYLDERTQEVYYKALINIPKTELNTYITVKLYPGMPVQVLILTERQTVFSYFFRPIRESFTRAFREQ